MRKKAFMVEVCIVLVVFLIFFAVRLKAVQEDATPGTTVRKFEKESLANSLSGKIIPPSKIPNLGTPGVYKMDGDILDVELSVWPGYAPLIVANGGLEPNPESIFFKKYGFKLRIVLSEEEGTAWESLHSGKLGVTSTTVDVVALYGDQLKCEVPLQLDYSRGGDAILVDKEITSINQLKGKIVVVAQYTSSDFFIRFLAQAAGVKVIPLADLAAKPDRDCINLLFTETGFGAADIFAESLKRGDHIISGAVTWSPKDIEVLDLFPKRAKLLVTSRNMLLIADVLVVNPGFAAESPKVVQGLVDGFLTGADMMSRDPLQTLPLVATAFNLSVQKLRTSLRDIHISNHAENMAFFSDQPGLEGTFCGLYDTAVATYGEETISYPILPKVLQNRAYLEAIAQEGTFADQVPEVSPTPMKDKPLIKGRNPLLTTKIRFYFPFNTMTLDLQYGSNKQSLNELANLLKVMPGAYISLRGHVDSTKISQFRTNGDDSFKRVVLLAVQESIQRAVSVKAELLKVAPAVDASHIDAEGCGWEEPEKDQNRENNRSVEVQVFTIE